MNKMDKRTEKAIYNKWFVKIFCKFGDVERTFSGYIIGQSKDVIILIEEYDFIITGYVILQKKDIKKIQHNKTVKYFEYMLEQEGLSKKVKKNKKINLSDWPGIFKSIKKHYGFAIVEREKKKRNAFTIGTIEKAGQKYVYVWHFDAQGYWMKKPDKIKYEDITNIQFDNLYINTFKKYLK